MQIPRVVSFKYVMQNTCIINVQYVSNLVLIGGTKYTNTKISAVLEAF